MRRPSVRASDLARRAGAGGGGPRCVGWADGPVGGWRSGRAATGSTSIGRSSPGRHFRLGRGRPAGVPPRAGALTERPTELLGGEGRPARVRRPFPRDLVVDPVLGHSNPRRWRTGISAVAPTPPESAPAAAYQPTAVSMPFPSNSTASGSKPLAISAGKSPMTPPKKPDLRAPGPAPRRKPRRMAWAWIPRTPYTTRRMCPEAIRTSGTHRLPVDRVRARPGRDAQPWMLVRSLGSVRRVVRRMVPSRRHGVPRQPDYGLYHPETPIHSRSLLPEGWTGS